MRKTTKKSLISLFIAFVMILNLVPFGAITSYALSEGYSADVNETIIDLGTVRPGYTNSNYVQNIAITNTGTNFFYHQHTRFELTGKDADKFEAGCNGGGVFSVGQTTSTTYYIRPISNLDTGTYTATVAYQLSENFDEVYETLDTFTVKFTVLEHNFSDAWTTTQYEHWHECLDDDCSGKGSLGAHDSNVTRNAVEPTFDTDGFTGDKYCSVCDYKVENGKPIAAGKYIRESRATMTPAALIAGNTPSDYTITSTEPTKYTIKVGNWWDLTTEQQITPSTELIKDHQYRIAIVFEAVGNYVYNETEGDYGSNFYVNGNEIGTTLLVSYSTSRVYDTVCLDGSTPIYTVTFDSNGGSKVPSQMVNEGQSPSTPEKPTKNNLVFWNWKKAGSNIWDLSTLSITEDTTLVAVWVTTYNILTDGNGKVVGTDSAVEPSSYNNSGFNGIIYEGETKYFWAKGNDGYEFKEWQNLSDGTTYSTNNPIVIKTGNDIGPEVKAIFKEKHVHSLTFVAGTQETCTTAGNKPYYTCSECGDWFIDSKGENLISNHSEVIIPAKGHDYKAIVTKATLTKNGSIVEKCSRCGGVKSTKAIVYPKTLTLSKTSFTYNKKVQKPTVTAKDSNGTVLKIGTDYTITYSNNSSKKVGEYKVTITFKGNYEGTKTFTYIINPKGTSLKKLTKGSKQFKATWKKQKTETSGYELQYATNKKFTSGKKKVKITKNKTTSSTVKKLKSKKKYYVRIRTYKTVNGKKFYSGWSKVLNVKTK